MTEEQYEEYEEKEKNDILLRMIQDKFDELTDIWNEADENERLANDDIRDLISTQIDIIDLLIGVIRALGFANKIVADVILSMKDVKKAIDERKEELSKKDTDNINMFL